MTLSAYRRVERLCIVIDILLNDR